VRSRLNTLQAKSEYVRNLLDDKCDPKLGRYVRARLSDLKLDSNIDVEQKNYSPDQAHYILRQAIDGALSHLGLDTRHPSIEDTPKRFATMFVGELTKGLNYDFFPKCTTTPNDMSCNELVRVAGIRATSTLAISPVRNFSG
jgi:hypothetical protein